MPDSSMPNSSMPDSGMPDSGDMRHPPWGAPEFVAQAARWVLRAQLGDRDALDALLRATQAPLWRFLRSLLADDPSADDCLQDVLVLVARKLALLDEPRAYRAWVMRTAAREALRGRRRQRTRPAATSVDEVDLAAPEPPATLDEDERAALAAEIRGLSPNTRAVVVLHYYEGLTLSEVASALELPLGTVKSRLATGLARLRERIERTNDE